MWVRCNIIALAAKSWCQSFCRRGRVVVVADCSAVEYDHRCSQRPTRDLHCLTTSNEAPWRLCMSEELYHGRRLHSPTHSHLHCVVQKRYKSVPRNLQRTRAILLKVGIKFAAKSCKLSPHHINNVSTLFRETWIAHCARGAPLSCEREKTP